MKLAGSTSLRNVRTGQTDGNGCAVALAGSSAIPAGDEHITLAHGRDYGDVSLLAGVLKTSGAQEARQSVDVVPLG